MKDFILNESFHAYVTGESNKATEYWTKWIKDHPERIDEFNEAIEMVQVLLKARIKEDRKEKEKSLDALLRTIDTVEHAQTNPLYRISTSSWVKIAAVLLAGLIVTSFFALWKPATNAGDQQAYFSVIVPEGEKSQIILSDSTRVWINSGSKLIYPSDFGKKSREVFLQGEAFFDVTHKDNVPFTVATNDVYVKVLGTKFNVKSYADEKTVETTVIKGKVRVDSRTEKKTVFLNPNEKAIFHKEENQLEVSNPLAAKPIKTKDVDLKNLPMPVTVKKVNTETITSWKDQHLVFSDEKLEDMIVRMERWYNIKIILKDDSLRNQRYTGKFVHNETIYQVLKAIKLTTPIKFKVEEDKILIYSSKNPNSN